MLSEWRSRVRRTSRDKTTDTLNVGNGGKLTLETSTEVVVSDQAAPWHHNDDLLTIAARKVEAARMLKRLPNLAGVETRVASIVTTTERVKAVEGHLGTRSVVRVVNVTGRFAPTIAWFSARLGKEVQ